MGRQMVVMLKRKAGITKAEFRDYYETRHIVLADQYFGDLIGYHTRIYLDDVTPFPEQWNELVPGAVLADYDAVSFYSYKDDRSAGEYSRRMADKALSRLLIEDEERFLDRASCRYGFCDVVQGPGMR